MGSPSFSASHTSQAGTEHECFTSFQHGCWNQSRVERVTLDPCLRDFQPVLVQGGAVEWLIWSESVAGSRDLDENPRIQPSKDRLSFLTSAVQASPLMASTAPKMPCITGKRHSQQELYAAYIGLNHSRAFQVSEDGEVTLWTNTGHLNH